MRTLNFWMVVLFTCFSFCASSQDANQLFAEANDAYVAKSYDKAIQLYESIYEQDLKSPELFLNLGNAYFQQSKYAQAILAYERGLKLSPSDNAILENLETANNQLDSEILEVPPFILVRWWRSFSNIFSTTLWAVVQILLLVLIAFMVGRYFLKTDLPTKRKSLKTAFLVVPFLALSFLAGITKDNITKDETAVIMTETALTDGPDARSGEINKLYPGNTVFILDQIGEWYKVRLANQSIGWIEGTHFEKI